MKNWEGWGAVCQRHAHIHVPVWVNNSWRGCAELKVCHCVWGAAVEGDVVFIFDGEVMGWGSLKAAEEGGGLWVVGEGGGGVHTLILTPQGRIFSIPLVIWGGGGG